MMTIEEAWAALEKPLFDYEWAAASGEDTAEAHEAVEAAVLALCRAVNEQYANPLAVRIIYQNTKAVLGALAGEQPQEAAKEKTVSHSDRSTG